MEVRMEYTEGLGRAAEVWVDGRLLNVCDAVSRAAKRCPPGVLTGVTFQYVTVEGFTWEQAVRANPDRKRTLTPLRGWSYTGYGQVVQIMPVIVDFGLLRMADANWTYDERLVGRYVRIDIERLEITWSSAPDWPEDAR